MADPIENRLWFSEQPPGQSSTPEGGGDPRKVGRRAVVVGAGIGGLSAAGALAKSFDQVDVLERDDLATSARSRSGTPQDRHPHGLLAGGLRALDQIFPGFESVLPKRDFGISVLCATRPQMTEIGVDISCSTAVVDIPRDATDDWKLVLTLSDSPHPGQRRVALYAQPDVRQMQTSVWGIGGSCQPLLMRGRRV